MLWHYVNRQIYDNVYTNIYQVSKYGNSYTKIALRKKCKAIVTLAAIVVWAKEPNNNDYCNDNPYSATAKPSAAVVAATTARIAGGTCVAVISHYYLPFLSAAVIFTFAAFIVIVHKKKNNKDNKPEYWAITFTATAIISKEIEHKKNHPFIIIGK